MRGQPRFRMPSSGSRIASAGIVSAWIYLASARTASAQTTPIAIVPVDGVQLTGALDVADGKAMIGASGSVTAGDRAVTVTLPHRGNLRICPTTKVGLTADSSIQTSAQAGNPAVESPGLMMALDRGALEANFATGKNSDVILTPDFRILISGPGVAQVQVRLGPQGDTCVDNRGPEAPYVTVSSIFDGGAYRVQPDQRVMFQHGSLREVVDREKESCGCPPEPGKSDMAGKPATPATANEFPLAQSEGLAPLATAPPNATVKGTTSAQVTAQLGYDGTQSPAAVAAAQIPVAPAAALPVPPAPAPQPKPGFFTRIGHFFKKLFGG